MPLDVAVLQSSFALVIERAPDLTARFYAVLFERYPASRRLFGPSLRTQEEMLTRALAAVIAHLEDEAWLGETLRALGAKHVAYGVTDAMYGWVGDALLATLAEAAKEAWTPELAQAWRDAYAAIAGAMLEGAHALDSAPSTLPRGDGAHAS